MQSQVLSRFKHGVQSLHPTCHCEYKALALDVKLTPDQHIIPDFWPGLLQHGVMHVTKQQIEAAGSIQEAICLGIRAGIEHM